jgi:hypothetical protein
VLALLSSLLLSCRFAAWFGDEGGGRGFYGVASRKWIDVQECEDFVRFEELEGGDVALGGVLAVF